MTRWLTALLLLALSSANADTIAVIGTGNVGSALGPAFAGQGHTIIYGSRDPASDKVSELVARTGNGASAMAPADAAAGADVVILAVPGLLVEDITRQLGDLSGKIIIDPTNPLSRPDGRFEHSVDTSNTEIIQAAAPDAAVVKAFSTITWQAMADPSVAGGPVSVPIVGNDPAAKARVQELVDSIGLEAIDLGDARDARWVEGMLILWINNRYGGEGRPAFEYYLRKL